MKIKIRKKDGKFKLWSTNVDAWYFGKTWLSRKQAVAYLKSRVMDRAKKECEDLEDTFPNGFWDMDNRHIHFNKPKQLKD
jgi:hypothetical protein